MGIIRLLADDVVQKIAAGEVIESPASVIKELVENSVDAGAHRIEVEVRQAGKELIRVTDDGEGIAPEDLPLAVLAHATSKLERAEELAAVHTLGFRGEALASIAAVSRLEIISRPPAAGHAHRIFLQAGEMQTKGADGSSVVSASGPPGTSVIVRELFFNTPARFKFLRSDAALRRTIVDLIGRLALAHPRIAFRLLVEGEERLLTPGDGNLLAAATALWGSQVARQLLTIPREEGLAGSIQGLMGRPGVHRNNRQDEVFVLNGRVIESRVLSAALERAYESLLPPRRYPLAVLHLEIDPAQVDVNVHPTKREVRFRDESSCFRLVHFACLRTLQQHGSAARHLGLPAGRPGPQPGYSPPVLPAAAGTVVAATAGSTHPASPDMTVSSTIPLAHGEAPDSGQAQDRGGVPASAADRSSDAGGSGLAEAPQGLTAGRGIAAELRGLREVLPELRLLGQFHLTYIVGESADALWLIDQHIAHERVIFDELRTEYETAAAAGREAPAQELLLPVPVELAPSLLAAVGSPAAGLSSFWDELTRLGFRCEAFGPRQILVRSLPLAWGRLGREMARPADIEAAIAQAWAAWGGEGGRAGADREGGPEMSRREKIWATVSCKAAIKAGERLTTAQIEELLQRLARTRHPFTCPHGRPIVVALPLAEIDRRFGRPAATLRAD
ncbi:MAG: DNA mismatch repair endonuclease MutL [Bacteroidota bacterium]